MARIRLLSTDFDGTLIMHPSDGRCGPAFAEAIRRHKAGGGLWAVNTGRSLAHAIEGLEIFGAPVEPDFLLTNEREIFERDSTGTWQPHHEWNLACYRRHDELFERSSDIIESIRSFADGSPHVTLIEEEGRPAGLVTATEDVMHDVAAFIDREAGSLPDFRYQRNTIYLRFCHRDYHKGSSLLALSGHLGIATADVMAAGDHFNDIPMLDGLAARMTCCPSNAIPEVKDVVLRAGGYVAAQEGGAGVAQAWEYFHTAL